MSNLVVFGDCITAGTGVATPWPSLVASSGNYTLINKAVSASITLDQTFQANATTPISGADYALSMVGNDAWWWDENPVNMGRFEACQRAIAVMMLADVRRVKSSSVYKFGAWYPFSSETFFFTTGPGAALETIVSGTAVYIGIRISGHADAAVDNAKARVLIDGADMGEVTGNGLGCNSYLGNATGIACYRFAGLSAGPHNVRVEATSESGDYLYAEFIAGSANGPGGRFVFGNGFPSVEGSMNGGKVYGKASRHALYRAIVQRVASELASDGLDVRFMDCYSALNLATDYADFAHPNQLGQDKIAAAFLAALSISPAQPPAPNPEPVGPAPDIREVFWIANGCKAGESTGAGTGVLAWQDGATYRTIPGNEVVMT